MAHKTLIGGTSYETKSGKTLIDDTGYDIKKGRTLVNGTGYDISFGIPVGELAVGTSVYMNVNGVRKEWMVVHQGKPSSLYDNSCNGTWLLMKDIYSQSRYESNQYSGSTIHYYLNGTFLGLFETDIQNAIKQVKIPYAYRNIDVYPYAGVTPKTGADGLSAKIFLLSCYECGWTTSDSSYFPVDGAKLDYFTASSDGNSKRIAYYNGAAGHWWYRSPRTNQTSAFWSAYTDGRPNVRSITDNIGVRPALIFPQEDVKIDDNFNIVV